VSLAQQAKHSSIWFLALSFGLRWGYNVLYILYKGFSPMEHAILHMVFALISLVLGFMAIQLFRKSTPSGSNLGCFFLVLLLLNFVFAVGSVFAALIHLFSANGGEIESIWLM
jgi:fatty acid desaturase